MKCYECKKPEPKSAIRVFMPAKNKREKASFRDICEMCYPIIMKNKGLNYFKEVKPMKACYKSIGRIQFVGLSRLDLDTVNDLCNLRPGNLITVDELEAEMEEDSIIKEAIESLELDMEVDEICFYCN